MCIAPLPVGLIAQLSQLRPIGNKVVDAGRVRPDRGSEMLQAHDHEGATMQRRVRRTDHRLALDDERLLAFWRERHLCTLTTSRADGTPHVVPTGATLDAEAGILRVITSGSSVKARHVARAGADGLPVAVCQVDG